MKTIEEITGEVDRIRMEADRLSMSPDTPLLLDLATAFLELLKSLSEAMKGEMIMSLDQNEARSLTSREMAKVISAVFFGFSSWCEIDDIAAAMDHFAEHVETYKSMLKHMEIINKNIFIKQ